MAREMKQSGIPWVGNIPFEWTVSPLKTIIKWKSEKNRPDTPVLSLYRDYGVIPKDSRDDNHNVTSLDTSGYKYVEPGDLVVNKMKAWQGSIAVSDYEGIISPAYHVCQVYGENVKKRYLHYLLRNVSYLPEYMRLSTGMRVGQWDLGFDDLKNIPIVLPDIDEQQSIVSFLDSECSRIDSVIEQTRASIEEYKKLKHAVITEAVTKGIRPGRKMKDSWIEWIGEIPEEWVQIRFKFFAQVKANLVEPDEYGDYPQVSPENIEKGSGRLLPCRKVSEVGVISGNHLFYKGQILYSKIRPKLNKITIAPFNGLCSADMYPIETKQNIKFLLYAMLSDVLLSQVSMITEDRVKMPKINQNELGNTWFALPPIEEQAEIVEYLLQKCSELDRLIEAKQCLITELEAYKKSLIFGYVTGKKEVPV